jgi:hypothetical protein
MSHKHDLHTARRAPAELTGFGPAKPVGVARSA